MRKRPVARPRLEPIEDRLVPSVASLFDPTAGIRSAIASLSHAHPAQVTKAHAAHPAAAHRAGPRAAAHHSHPSRTVHPVHHHSSPPKSSSSGNSFSDFFKNLFSGAGL